MTFGKKYRGKDIYVAFPDGDAWYLYPHDELLAKVLRRTGIRSTRSWSERGGDAFKNVTKQMRRLLGPYRIGAPEAEPSGRHHRGAIARHRTGRKRRK